ncbi:general transcriptional corepressor trfA [Musca vetustissima]|uniref:general transcriptional corepressor trfA n=1 Tax=Musca vetustissima TaxID=27455 RepID=UPI002AB6A8A6|nr:general transcriptional corepressor trfA [Musca vetustissima]
MDYRSQQNQSSHNTSSPTHSNNSSKKLDIKLEDEDKNNNKNSKPNETLDSMPIENIIFDFSPSKKTEEPTTTSSTAASSSQNKLKGKQLEFHDNTIDIMPPHNDDDQTTMMISGKSADSSSVVILTPATQDIIFLDDTSNEFSDINTMDLLADVQKQETEYLENLKRYESKSIEKQLRQEVKQQPLKSKEEKKHNFIKPAALIKKEKESQNLMETKMKTVLENDLKACSSSYSSSKKPICQNPLLANDDDEEEYEEEEEDAMPKPIIVKREPLEKNVMHNKKLSLKERFNIDCEECEKLLRLLPNTLSDREIEMHLQKCKFHNRQDFMRQNTPENFWNPFILSFDENDPRNEILIDTRFKDKKGH